MCCIEAQQCNVWWSGSIAPVIHVDPSQDWGLASRTVFLRRPQHPMKEPLGTCCLEGWLWPRVGACWDWRKYLLCGRLFGPQNRSGFGGIEGSTCCVEGWFGPRTVRRLVESKEIPLGCSMSNSNFTISSELSGLCFLKSLVPAGVKPSCVLVQARQRCVAWQHVTAFNHPEMSPAGLWY